MGDVLRNFYPILELRLGRDGVTCRRTSAVGMYPEFIWGGQMKVQTGYTAIIAPPLILAFDAMAVALVATPTVPQPNTAKCAAPCGDTHDPSLAPELRATRAVPERVLRTDLPRK